MKISKYRFIFLLIIALAFGSVSCNKLLDVPPQGKLQFEEFWLSKDQCVASIAGIYSNLGSSDWNFSIGGNLSATAISPIESYIFWGELRGELLASNVGKMPSDQIQKENIDNLAVAPGDVTTKYTAFYKIINQTNQAIKYIPGVRAKDPAFTAEDEANLMGEAYFLRAYAYFWLLRTFKEVPLVLDPSETDSQDYNVPKVPADTLSAQIVKDLELAKQKLPAWYSSQQYSHCRATKYTAMCVLADVYLTVASMNKNVTNNAALYDKVISNCDAVMTSGKYAMIPGMSFGSLFASGNTDESIFETYSNYQVNNQVNNLYSWFTSIGYFLVAGPADDLYASLNFADYRGSAVPKGPYPPGAPVVGYAAASRFVMKYSNATKDSRWIYYRYPDVLLMKAEALAHRYKDDAAKLKDACDLVNMIRYRASGINTYTKATASTTYEMDNILLDERGREFLGEGKRWFELVRFASRDNFASKNLLVDRVVNAFSGVVQLVIAPRVNNPESWYLPLNADALSANHNLIQNPYYQ